MITQLRLLLSDKLLEWAVALVPDDHPDKVPLMRAVLAYLGELPAPKRKGKP